MGRKNLRGVAINGAKRKHERLLVAGPMRPIAGKPGLADESGRAHIVRMGEESGHQYTIRVKDRHIGLNPFRWAIYRAGWPVAVKRAASVYKTAEKCRIAGSKALREFLANIARRKKNKERS